jgi:hypothetical protein
MITVGTDSDHDNVNLKPKQVEYLGEYAFKAATRPASKENNKYFAY